MTDEAKHLISALRNSYDYSSQRDKEAADLIEKLSLELDRVKADLALGTAKKATDREKLRHLLTAYFNIGDSYEYSLTRVKEAFELGTMTFEDFSEFDDAKVADIADYLIDHGVMVARPGRWIQVDDTKCRCSKCEVITLIAQYPHGNKNFCPNCGAKMELKTDG